MSDMSREDALAHFGVKGMKWGVRKEESSSSSVSLSSNPASKKQAQKDLNTVATRAQELIRESRRATTPAEREAAAKKYEAEMLPLVKSPEFKATYQKANTMSKGEVTAHVIIAGPLAAVTIPVARATYKNVRENGPEHEIDVAYEVLREMRS